MALRYFDRNGTTAGFGTLTGAWDTTTASWSDSSAGTAVPTTFTFSDVDQAQFGSAGSTSTASTATIAAGLNVTVNQIITANLAALQTIAAGASGTLTLAGTTPTINVSSAGGLTISAPITGTAGFTKAGSGTLTLNGSLASLIGTISMNQTTSGYFRVNNASYITIASGTTFSVTGPADFGASNNRSLEIVPTATTFTLPTNVAFSGTGAVYFSPSTSSGQGHILPANALSALDGTTIPGTTNFLAPTTGFVHGSNAFVDSTIVTVRDFPSVYSFYFYTGAGTGTRTMYYTGAGTSYGTRIDVASANTIAPTAMNATLYANHSSGTLTLTGGITRYEQTGQARTVTLTLRGTGNAVESGAITQVSGAPYGSGILAITKADANRWILSGANTYTGTTTISAGTLSAQGIAGTRTPLGGTSAGDVTVSSTGTLDISSTGTDAANLMTVNKAGRALTLGGTGSPQLSATTGFSEYVCAGVTLNTNLPVNIAAGAYLRMGNTAAMSQSGGTWGITKTGDGEYNLGATSNTFAGVVTVTGGTLSFETSVPSGAISPLGNATSAIVLSGTTLKYRGAGGHTLGRAVSLSGSPSFDASGTGAVTFSPAITHAAGARTITFKGSSTNDNTFTTALTNNGLDAVSVTKTEAGKWILSGAPSYTGDTTVSAGTLTFNGQTVQQNVVMNGTGVLDNTVLAGPKNITCNGGTPEIKANANNTVSGATSITSGSLRVTTEVISGGKPVKVLGDTAVTVDATLQTTVGTVQRGQARYGGNLTFSAGSTLRIG